MYARNLQPDALENIWVIDVAGVGCLVKILAGNFLLEHERNGRNPVHNVGDHQENADERRGYENALFAVRNFPNKHAHSERK